MGATLSSRLQVDSSVSCELQVLEDHEGVPQSEGQAGRTQASWTASSCWPEEYRTYSRMEALEVMAVDRKNLSTDQINDLIVYWRPKLGIADWIITHGFVNQADMPKRLAQVNWHLGKRIAMVDFVIPGTVGEGYILEDQEVSLVHELLHVASAGLIDRMREEVTKEEDSYFFEQPTEILSNTLVQLRRAALYRFEWET